MIPCDAWAEIDLNVIKNNIKRLKRLLKNGTRFMAVVKADAYGHGAVEIARCATDAGADMLGVARLGEAVELRHAGIETPILVFGHTPCQHAAKLMAYGLTQSIFSYQDAAELSVRAVAAGRRIKVHVKIDTGMGRLGIPADGGPGVLKRTCGFENAVAEVIAVTKLEGLICDGIYTHFATADEIDKTNTVRQLGLFHDMIRRLEKQGVGYGIRHAANSAALINLPDSHMDMVRAGISIYGHYPSKDVNPASVELIPAMTLKSRIVYLKKVGAGFSVSYGSTVQTVGKTTIASVAIGYADGFARLLSSRGKMMVRNRLAPVMGRVCMDTTMIDVGHIPGVTVGDEVTIFGKPGTGALSVDRLAEQMSTINYEVLTNVSGRVLRIYSGEKSG